MVDVVIIGAGLFGSAAARHLAEAGAKVTIIGPAEPADLKNHQGVFASHYDEGRLTRRLGVDPIWSALAGQSLAGTAALEAAAGLPFHTPSGSLFIGPPTGNKATKEGWYDAYGGGGEGGERFPPGSAALRKRFPAYKFPSASPALLEPAPAGHINPRRLVTAQLRLASDHGATHLPETAVQVQESDREVIVATDQGHRVAARQVLLAAGAFSNFHALWERPLPLRLKTETIILAEVSPDDADRLAVLPVIIYQVNDPDLSDVYLVPPLPYPDGGVYVKMGANTRFDRWPETLSEVQKWFHTGPPKSILAPMSRHLRRIMPDTDFLSIRTHPCVVCYTPSGYPLIDRLSERVFVAAGGNGRGAKGSDTIGRLAALMMLGELWPTPFDPRRFALTAGLTNPKYSV